jgi:hypothetical protein
LASIRRRNSFAGTSPPDQDNSGRFEPSLWTPFLCRVVLFRDDAFELVDRLAMLALSPTVSPDICLRSRSLIARLACAPIVWRSTKSFTCRKILCAPQPAGARAECNQSGTPCTWAQNSELAEQHLQ